MPERCQFATANGLPTAQTAVLESIVEAISSGSNPVDCLKASEPLVSKLLQIQPEQPPLRPRNQSRYATLMQLQQWVAENVPESQAGVLWQFSKNGNSVSALRPLDSGSVFISIPKSLMLQAAPGVLQIDPFCAKIPSVALTLQLLIERRTPSSLPLSLYIASLPTIGYKSLDSAWLWGFAEIQALLEGTSAFKKAVRTRLSTIQHYVYIMGRLKLPEVLAGLTLAEWMWASAIILSRQNQLPDGTPVLVPCWDMCNDKHSGAESYFVKGENRLVAECKAPIEHGDEIFINYGQRTSAQLLVLQGYLHDQHPTPVNVQASLFDFGALPDDIGKLRNMLFSKRSFGELPMIIYPDGTVSSALQSAARIACLDREAAGLLLRNPESEIICETNETKSRAALKVFLLRLQQDALRAYTRLQSLRSTHDLRRITLAKSLVNMEMKIIEDSLKRLEASN